METEANIFRRSFAARIMLLVSIIVIGLVMSIGCVSGFKHLFGLNTVLATLEFLALLIVVLRTPLRNIGILIFALPTYVGLTEVWSWDPVIVVILLLPGVVLLLARLIFRFSIRDALYGPPKD